MKIILCSLIMSCNCVLSLSGQLNTKHQLLEDNTYTQKVDSLFLHHISSLKSNVRGGMITNKQVSDDDKLFLNFIYYLSGIQIEEDHSYGNLPLYIKPSEIKEIEVWYYSKKDKIKWDNVSKIYFLMDEMKSAKADDFDELESIYNKINKELSTLRVK